MSIGALLIPVYCGGSGKFSVGGVGAGLLTTGVCATGAGSVVVVVKGPLPPLVLPPVLLLFCPPTPLGPSLLPYALVCGDSDAGTPGVKLLALFMILPTVCGTILVATALSTLASVAALASLALSSASI